LRFRFHFPEFPSGAEALRQETREFLEQERAASRFMPRPNCWVHYDAAFTQRCGESGLIGIIFPKEYGGRAGTPLDRHVVCEEMLAAGAPVGMHWIADRQSGPLLLRHGSEAARRQILPEIAAGRCCVGIGMSEAGAGSDLAAIRTRADKVGGGWRITGSKLWTSHAHRAQYMTLLARSAPVGEDRHLGLTQFIVDMHTVGVRANPIEDLTGSRDFNEVALDNVFVSDEFVVGNPGDGWKVVMSELTHERSGPERFLSTYTLLADLVERVKPVATPADYAALGRLIAHLATLRGMSTAIAGMLSQGLTPDVEAALVKDLGTAFEREVPEIARELVDCPPQPGSADSYAAALAEAILAAPSFTLRGGTREILRGIVARQLGLR
jgi:alkylation response protein AidB-like acyl-CoA dehydrogenase